MLFHQGDRYQYGYLLFLRAFDWDQRIDKTIQIHHRLFCSFYVSRWDLKRLDLAAIIKENNGTKLYQTIYDFYGLFQAFLMISMMSYVSCPMGFISKIKIQTS